MFFFFYLTCKLEFSPAKDLYCHVLQENLLVLKTQKKNCDDPTVTIYHVPELEKCESDSDYPGIFWLIRLQNIGSNSSLELSCEDSSDIKGVITLYSANSLFSSSGKHYFWFKQYFVQYENMNYIVTKHYSIHV